MMLWHIISRGVCILSIFATYYSAVLSTHDVQTNLFGCHIVVEEGVSKNVRAFNCVQRSHQQILESFTGYCMTVLFSGIVFPVTTTVFATLWLYSRSLWVAGYAESDGDPSKRYSKPFAKFFWMAMLTLFMTSSFAGISIIAGSNIFWDVLPDLM